MQLELFMRLASFYHLSPSILMAFVLSQSASLYAQTYSADFNESEWTAKSGSFACSLSHKIPGFGTAQFVRNTGVSEFMELKPASNVVFSDLVRVESVPPMWRTDAAASPLGQLQVSGKQPLRVTSAQVGKISAALEQGTNVVFSSAQANANGENLRVALEARNFNPAYGRYKACIGALIPYTFDQIARMLINYAPNASELDGATKTQLDKIVRYTKADPKVIGILVDAHSDKLSTSEEGDAASQRQAELVAAYLVSKGVSAGMITTRWHGDKFPIANNYNKVGQARNRRVTVRLESEATRKEMEKKIASIIAAEEKAAEQKAAAEKAAQEKAAAVPAALPASLQQLEQMVEGQDLTSGKQPTLKQVQ
jgi:outer membrane protein OmpA-like peptidoglycan-associated protein